MASFSIVCLPLCLLALADTHSPPPDKKDEVTLRAHVLEIEGVEWRIDPLLGLQAVEQQGAVTVWMGDARTIKKLISTSMSCAAVDPDTTTTSTRYVSSVQRIADAPPGEATRIAFKPTLSQIQAGTDYKLSAIRNEKGVVATVAIDDTQMVALHTAPYAEKLVPKGSVPASSFAVQIQVPEVLRASASGQWTIPAGQALVIGLGVHLVSDPAARRHVLRERVIVLDAGDLDASLFTGPTAAARQRTSARISTALTAASALLLVGIGLTAAWSWRRRARRSGQRLAKSLAA